MRGRSLTSVGETEMEILDHVWDLGEATVSDVRERILENRDVAYTTVMTILKNLTEKGYLTYEKRGAAYVYSPARPADEVRRSLVSDLITKAFKGSPLALVQTLVRHEEFTGDERRTLISLIEELEDDDEQPD